MDVADGFSLEQQGSSVHYEVLVYQGKIKANLVMWVSASPKVAGCDAGYFVPEGSTVILEQPEIHCIPSPRRRRPTSSWKYRELGEYSSWSRRHSENLFRRLQFLIAEEKISPEDCRLYFVKRDKETLPCNGLKWTSTVASRTGPTDSSETRSEKWSADRRTIERMAKGKGTEAWPITSSTPMFCWCQLTEHPVRSSRTATFLSSRERSC